MRFEWTDKKKKKALQLYVDREWPLRKIADYFECGHSTVQRLMEAENVMRKRVRVFTKAERSKIKRWYFDENLSLNEIVVKLKSDFNVVTRYIKEQGWDRGSAGYHRSWKSRRKETYKKYLTNKPSSYGEYTHAVRGLAYPVWHEWKEVIDPLAKKLLDGYQIDHRISVYAGWKRGIPVEVVAHPANFRVINPLKNMSKGRRCSVKLSVLLSEIAAFEATHGKVF